MILKTKKIVDFSNDLEIIPMSFPDSINMGLSHISKIDLVFLKCMVENFEIWLAE